MCKAGLTRRAKVESSFAVPIEASHEHLIKQMVAMLEEELLPSDKYTVKLVQELATVTNRWLERNAEDDDE